MKIGFIGAIPPGSVLPDWAIAPRYRKNAHPAPWIGGLLPNLAQLSDFKLRIFIPHRAVLKSCVIERDGVEYEGVPSPLLERFAPHTLFYSKSLAVAGAIRRYQPDLIHAFGMENGSATVALRQNVPVSCFIQGIAERLLPYYGHRGIVQKQVAVRTERSAVRRLRWLVAETEFARDWALGHQPAAHVAVIPHPLRQEFLDVKATTGGKHIVSVGGLDDRKGMDTVIRALAKIQDKETTLSIVGSGPSLGHLKQLASDLGVADRVEFSGFADQAGVMEQLSRASVYVIGSRMDTSPNVVTEAHAAGLPVVGTRAGGIPEMIADGVDGYHVDIDDDEGMARKVEELLANPLRGKRMGDAGREKVRVENAPLRVAEAHVEFFNRINHELGC
jgi:glycosyltransferase involved in cell wall biosynthesis